MTTLSQFVISSYLEGGQKIQDTQMGNSINAS